MNFPRIFLVALFLSSFFVAGVPSRSQAEANLSVEIFPREIRQGQTALLRVRAPEGVERVQAVFDGEMMPLYPTAEGDWVGFLAVNMSAERGSKAVEVYTWTGNQTPELHPYALEVVWGGFLYQNIVISGALLPLLDPNLNRQEYNVLVDAYARATPEKLWQGQLQHPPGDQISEFGGIRTYNDGVLEGRHTGVDFRAGLGEAVVAIGAGRVVYARHLPIHGNHVIIDHGWGVLSGYSHLSRIDVVPGQRVLAGTQIGAAGSTGRVQGAHLHLEIAVNGLWVNPLQFLSLTVPEAPQEFAARN